MSKRAIKKSVIKSVEYSIALFFVVLFMATSLYGIPNTGTNKATGGDQKNSNSTASKLDGSYKRYCVSDGGDGVCIYVALNDDVLLKVPRNEEFYLGFENNLNIFEESSSNSIRAPPVIV